MLVKANQNKKNNKCKCKSCKCDLKDKKKKLTDEETFWKTMSSRFNK